MAFLQGRLNQDGASPPLTVDGHFRGGTRAAVFEFQRRHGLRPDGIVGPQTWGMIDELARAGIAGAHDVMGETAAVTQAEATAIAAHMGTAAPTGPAMTVAGYEAEVVAALDAYYDRGLNELLPAPITSIAHAGRIRDVAQRLVDDYYSDHIVMASRAGDLTSYHPGNFVLPVADAASRPVDPVFARMWVQLDMLPAAPAPGRPVPGDVSFAHNVDTRRPEDEARVREIADRYLQSGRMQKVIRYIRAYPAEVSSGTAFLGLRASHWVRGDGPPPPLTPPVLRQAMWDLLSGLMHEYLHKVAHPHFSETGERMGGQAGHVLIEGFCDYFRKQVWDDLMPRFLSDAGLARRGRGTARPGRRRVAAAAGRRRHRPAPLLPRARAGDGDRERPRRRSARGGQRARRVLHGARRPARDRARQPAASTRRAASARGTPAMPARTTSTSSARAASWCATSGSARTARACRSRTACSSARRPRADRIPPGTRLRVRGIRHVRATSHDTRGAGRRAERRLAAGARAGEPLVARARRHARGRRRSRPHPGALTMTDLNVAQQGRWADWHGLDEPGVVDARAIPTGGPA